MEENTGIFVLFSCTSGTSWDFASSRSLNGQLHRRPSAWDSPLGSPNFPSFGVWFQDVPVGSLVCVEIQLEWLVDCLGFTFYEDILNLFYRLES